MQNVSRRLLITGLALLVSALACSTPGTAGQGEQTQPPVEATQPPIVEATQPSADPAAACPQASEGTMQYVSQDNGVCFLYPSDLKPGTAFMRPNQVAAFTGEPLDPNAMESALVRIEVAYNGPADVATSAEYGAKWKTSYGAGASEPVETTIGGLPAMMITDVPGMMGQQVGLVVANGQKYSITLMPPPDQFEGLKAQAEKAWETVTSSIVFSQPGIVPEVVRPEDVCPPSTEGDALFVDLAGGMCMIYPASFDNETQSPGGWFYGGPVLGDLFGGPLRVNLVIANGGPAEGKTPRQLFEPRLVNKEVSKIDDAGAQETTIGGYPAIVWTEGEPLGSRQAIIVANDRMYTIVNQPYNDPDYPGGEENVELIWKVVTETVAFFDIWY